MELILVFLVILLLASNIFVAYQFLKPKESKNENSESMLLLQRQLQDMNRTMDNRLGENNKAMQEGSRAQFQESRELIQTINREVNEQLRDVVKKTTEVSESSKQVFAVADQLKELQSILKNPKQRGILGEYYLETVLQNVLPPESFKMQYAFKDGEIVDAAVFVKGKVIPIDSKFSLEEFHAVLDAADGQDKVNYEKTFVND